MANTKKQPKSINLKISKTSNEKNRLRKKIQEINARRKLYSCTICKISFKLLSKFIDHSTKHVLKQIGLSPFPCELCEQSFHSNGLLERHMISHTGEKAYKCPLCSKGFSTKGHMKRHLSMLHTLEKPFKCEFCTKAFARKDDLTRHTWIHTDENHFLCGQCSETFKTPYAKRRHFNALHKTSN